MAYETLINNRNNGIYKPEPDGQGVIVVFYLFWM